MKVAHVPYTFFPDPIGGTEVYAAALAEELRIQQTSAFIAAPGPAGRHDNYRGLDVFRFQTTTDVTDTRHLYDEGDATAAENFARILDAEQPDLVHMHAFTRGASYRVLRECKVRRIPVIFTYHTPTVTCQRGTLLRWGDKQCDGKMRLHTCSACTLQKGGLPEPLARVTGALPPTFGKAVARAGRSNRMITALRMTEFIQNRHDVTKAFLEDTDRIVALARWSYELLLRNGIQERKIFLSRHGIRPNSIDNTTHPSVEESPVRYAFFGRLDRSKGVDTLIDALERVPELEVSLDIYGIRQGPSDDAYVSSLASRLALDPRISVRPPVDVGRVVTTISQYHAVLVPSRCFETGPLVILESFAAGVPVIGSRLGGIAELISHGKNGLLVTPQSISEWSAAIQAAARPGFLRQLARGVSPPRTMTQVAKEMIDLYHDVMGAAA